MIPKKYTGKMLKGRKARCLTDIANHGGCGVSEGTVVTILNVVRGKGLYIKTEKCPHCGLYAYITGVKPEDLGLL